MNHKIKILLSGIVLIVGLAPVVPVYASSSLLFNNSLCSGSGNSSAVCQDNGSPTNPLIGPNGLLLKVSAIIALIAGAAAIIVILISGLSFITSGGDPAKAQKARGALIGAIVGLVVIVLAESIIGFVLSKV
jgi:hypothetical protein